MSDETAARDSGARDNGARIQELSAAKRALLMRALLSESARPPARILRHPAGIAPPLSFAQQRMWFLQQLEPDSTAMNLYYAVRLRGPLDPAALESSVRAVFSRHAALRTTFRTVDGEPVQVVDEAAELRFPVLAVTAPTAAGRLAEALRRARDEAGRPFDLERGPVLRTALLRLDDDDHVLLLAMPHAVADGWSLGVLVSELQAWYTATVEGAPPRVPDLPIQYADYAYWQRTLPAASFAPGLAYWRDRLTGAPETLDLPTDRPRPPRQSDRGAVHPVVLPADLVGGLRELSRRTETTPFMTVLAAFTVLLHRYSNQTDVSVGTPIANRTRAETEELIGFFGNTLVLRTDLTGDPTFRELLGRVRATALGAYEHQGTPFEQLVEELRPARDPSHTPLFQVMFILQNAPLPPLDLPGMRAELLDVHNGTSKYDLTLDLTETAGDIVGSVEYCTDLFTAERIERFVGHLHRVLEAVVADPDRRLSQLPVLTTAERQQLVSEWNDTADEIPAACVHEIIQAQVGRTPDRVAARCGSDEITYAELNRRANRLARALVAAGVGPEVLVGLLAGRGIDYLAALLAVLKAGGAYLPLDPQQPSSRLGQMIRHSRCAVVLAADDLVDLAAAAGAAATAGAAAGGGGVAVADGPVVHRLGDLLARAADDGDLPSRSGPCSLAYVLYTSGSTGTPKGVMVEHAGLVNHLYAKIRDLGITGADVVAQNGPQSFDVSVWQFLAALTCGGRTEIFPDAVAHEPARLLAEVERCGVSVLQVVPSMLRELVNEAAARNPRPELATLRWIVPTGDALMAELCRRWFEVYPAIPMLNTYGSTECSDDQCHLAIHQPPAPDDPVPIVSIGRPVGNMQAYVLDERLAPVPVGVPGELYIGGLGVGRGYLDDPARTADMFRPDPFGARPGARLYRSRDQAQFHPDGTLEFLGRTDHLVKIRGFRVEPGEIEAVLAEHPAVRDSVVVARSDGTHKRLVAYVAGEATETFVADLRRFLRERLPDYLVPSGFVVLDSLPLNANGKVDRKALPTSDLAAAPRLFVAPRTPVEEAVATVWAEVLEVDRVSVEESFFDLGGHSLMATRVLSRLRRDFPVDLPLRLLFEVDTVAGLAAEIERRLAVGTDLLTLVDEVEQLTDEEVERLLGEPETRSM